MKALSIRLEDKLGNEFDEVCKRSGYKKNTLLTRLIESFVRHQKKTVSQSKKTLHDPFSEVIGLLNQEPMIQAPDTIDKAVYDL